MTEEFSLGDILVQIGGFDKWVVHGIQYVSDEQRPNGLSVEYSLYRVVDLDPRFWMEGEVPMLSTVINDAEAARFWVKVGHEGEQNEDEG